MQPRKPSIALVVPGLSLGGGVPAVATFLYRVLSESKRYTPHVISLATSARDQNSVRVISPASWLKGVQLTNSVWQSVPYRHVGAVFTEIEFQRYRTRHVLHELLGQHDMVQIVAGTPTWALVTKGYQGPVALQVATLTAVERVSRLRRTRGSRYIWLWLMTKIATAMEQAALRKVDAVFVENNWMFRHISREIKPKTVIFAPPGVDTDHFFPRMYESDGYILSVGRFSDQRKNIRLLFDAYHQLRQAVPQAPRLVLAGTAPTKLDWDHAVSLGISEWLKVHQSVSQEELANLYRGASLFVLSSDEEGLGMVILEAMASGLPVISTRCGGPETAVVQGITGYMTPVGDAHTLTLRMQELIQDVSMRRRMGQAGRQVAEERFSLDSAGKVYLEKYDVLLGTRG